MKCPKCGSMNVARERRPDGDDRCGACHHRWPSRESEVGHKMETQKQPFKPVELMEQWLAEGELDAVILIGIPKIGGWKYSTSDSSFEFLSAAEGVVQKLKLNALNVNPKK